MKQQGLLFFTEIDLTALGLLLFFIVFVGSIAWTFSKSNKKYFEYMEKLPLRKEE